MQLLGNKNASVLIIGVFHGDEPQGKLLIEQYLRTHANTNIAFIPCLNEYGYNHSVRTNENGVDLNRNFPTKNWVLSKKDNFFGGETPASEQQTQFIINTVKAILPKLIVTLHAPYKIVNYDGDAANIAKKISEIINYPVEKSIGYPTPGSFGSWAGIENGIPTITLELDEKCDIQELANPVFKIFEMLEKY